MKKFLLLCMLMLSWAGAAWSQTFDYSPDDTLFSMVDPSRSVELYYHAWPNGSQPIRLGWLVTTQNIPTGWYVTLCDNSICHELPHPGDTTGTLNPGDSTMLKLLAAPLGNLGNLKVVVHVFDIDHPSNAMDLTYLVTANGTAVAPSQVKHTISASPSPVHDQLYLRPLNGALERGTMVLYDLSGKVVATKTIAGGQSATLDVQALQDGIYLLRYVTRTGTTTEKIVVAH